MATANPRRRRKTTRRRNAAPAAAAVNPRRRRRTAAPARRRRNPVAALAVNPRRRRRRNPVALSNPRRRHTRRRRNPAVVNPSIGGIGKFAIAAIVGGVGSSIVTQVMRMLPIPNTGILGLAAQVGVGFLAAWGLPKTGLLKAETAGMIGTVVAAGGVANFAAPYLDFSQYLPAPAAAPGMADIYAFGRDNGMRRALGMNDVNAFAGDQFPAQVAGFYPQA